MAMCGMAVDCRNISWMNLKPYALGWRLAPRFLSEVLRVVLCSSFICFAWLYCHANVLKLDYCTLSTESDFYLQVLNNDTRSGEAIHVGILPHVKVTDPSVPVRIHLNGEGAILKTGIQMHRDLLPVPLDSAGVVVQILDKSYEYLQMLRIVFLDCRIAIVPAIEGEGLDVGIDLFTGAERTKRSAVVKLINRFDHEVKGCSYKWLSCGKKCQFVGPRDKASVIYENMYFDKINGPSKRFRAEQLLVEVGVPNNTATYFVRASESFTVIIVDAEVAGLAEENEENGNATIGISNVSMGRMSKNARISQTRVKVTRIPDADAITCDCETSDCECEKLSEPKSEGVYLVSAVDLGDAGDKGTFVVQHPASGARDKICFTKQGKIDSTTQARFPANKKRTKIGVGEIVDLAVLPSMNATWKTSAGRLQSGFPAQGNVLHMDDTTGSVQVEACLDSGIVLVKEFDVVAPDSMGAATFKESVPIDDNDVGVHFVANVPVEPEDVSFENVSFMEVGRDAINLWGEFKKRRITIDSHGTHGADRWFLLDERETDGKGIWPDEQGLVLDKDIYYVFRDGKRDRNEWPYVGEGGFEWPIPIQWRVGGNGNVHKFKAEEKQVFSVKDGTTTINKFQHSHSRTVPSL